MKLILNSDVQSLGRKGDVVDVAKGYARNYLLPKKLYAELISAKKCFWRINYPVKKFYGI